MNIWAEKLKMRLPAIILLVVTLLFWGFYDRYQPDGPVLLQAPSLADGIRVRGDCTETNGHFVLRVPEGGKPVSINFRMVGAADYQRIRVRGRIKADSVVKGRFPWSCARLLLLQYDEKEHWVPGHHGVGAVKGTRHWEMHEDVFEIMPDVAHMDVSIQQLGVLGTAKFDQIEAQPVRIRKLDPLWRMLFGGLWIAAGVFYFPRCRLHKRKLRMLIFINALAILFGALMPGKWIEDTTEYLKEAVAKSVEKPGQPEPAIKLTDKSAKPVKQPEQELARIDEFNSVVGGAHQSGHITLFATLCFLVYCSAALERQHPSYYFRVAFDIFLFAGITETLQYLTLDRSAGISDLFCDVYGMAFASIAFLLVRPLLMRKARGSKRPF